MKKIVLAVFMAAMALSLSAQINFREGGFAEALEAAKSENKLVFMDCYTSWCGPCKLMASKEFVQEKAGEYFNPRFVSVKIDMEKGEGVELRKRYAERLMKASELAERLQAYIILKGHYSALCHPDGKIDFCSTGNSGMATAGSGDVLTGIITGLLARGYKQEDACRLGMHLHGLANRS